MPSLRDSSNMTTACAIEKRWNYGVIDDNAKKKFQHASASLRSLRLDRVGEEFGGSNNNPSLTQRVGAFKLRVP